MEKIDPGMTSSEAKSLRARAEKLNDEFMQYLSENTAWFREVHRNETFSILDYTATDYKGRKCAVETKVRDCDVFKYDSVFIEEKKMLELQKAYYNGERPVYINWFQDKYHVLVWDLTQYFKEGGKLPECKDVTIANKGYNRYDQHEVRFLLPQRDGHYYTAVNGKFYKRF